MLAWVVLSNESGFAWETWLLIDIARVGLKISVGLVETLFYKKNRTHGNVAILQSEKLCQCELKC